MTWAKLDDRFHEHRKVKRVWRADPAAVGLHVMAITYCSGHETDGLVDSEFVEGKLPAKAARERAINALVDAGVWLVDEDGWRLHDFLEYNPSKADLDAKRAKDAERKANARQALADKRASEKRPRGLVTDAARTPSGIREESALTRPDPTRPDPFPPNPPTGELPPLPVKPGGNRSRGLAAFEDQVKTYAAAAFPNLDATVAVGLVSSALSWSVQPPTHDSVAAYVRRQTTGATA